MNRKKYEPMFMARYDNDAIYPINGLMKIWVVVEVGYPEAVSLETR